MNSKELVGAALRGEEVLRVPTGPLAVHFCAGVAGYTLREYTTSARVLAEAVVRYYERFKPDAVWLSADTWVSAEAMGAKVGCIGDNQPFGRTGEPSVRSVADIKRIPEPELGTQGRYALMLEALERIVKALGKEVFIVACFDQYPFSLAAGLMGLSQIMLKLYDDRALVKALMERCDEYALAYAMALGERGADMLSGGDSPAGLIGKRFYEEVALPHEKRLIHRLKTAAKGKLVSLHICGNTMPILPLMASSGADVLEIDHGVDLGHACGVVGPDMGLWGNLDPVGLLAQGTPAEVKHARREAIEAVRRAGHRRFVLSSGCTLAVETPHQNLEAMLVND